MLLQTVNTANHNMVISPKYNGLCCPRCSQELVDSIGTKIQAEVKETHCLICDYVSTYNTKTFTLSKNY